MMAQLKQARAELAAAQLQILSLTSRAEAQVCFFCVYVWSTYHSLVLECVGVVHRRVHYDKSRHN